MENKKPIETNSNNQHAPLNEGKEYLEHIDNFMYKCGFRNHNTVVNGGYGCNHVDCGDRDLVKVTKDGDKYVDMQGNYFSHTLLAKQMTKRNIRCNRRLAKKYIKKAKEAEFDNNKLFRFGYKRQGVCYCNTCPFGYEAKTEDFIAFGENPDSMTHGDWLVVCIDPKTNKPLKAIN